MKLYQGLDATFSFSFVFLQPCVIQQLNISMVHALVTVPKWYFSLMELYENLIFSEIGPWLIDVPLSVAFEHSVCFV